MNREEALRAMRGVVMCGAVCRECSRKCEAVIAYLESQQARDTAQAAQLRALEEENERLKVELERLCFVEVECEGMIHLRKQADAENERLRGLLKVAVGHHRSDCPCPCCKAVDSPAVKPAETIGPADDDALEIPLREASDAK